MNGKIRYISAGDRLNYGDFLFPIIFKHYFGEQFDIEYYGVIKSDFSKFGALPTHSFKRLKKDINPEADVIVIGGGEVFFGEWTNLYSYINPLYNYLMSFKLVKRVENHFNFAKSILGGGHSISPFVPDLKAKTIFISAGGQFNLSFTNDKNQYFITLLNKSPLLTVRDKRTLSSLASKGVLAKLLPDSAILISKIYDYNRILSLISSKNIIQNKPYLLLQLGKTKAPDDLRKFVSEINKLSKEIGLEVICSPIGLAPGHEDDVVLKRLTSLDSTWKYIHPQNIYDTMHLIANAGLYIGTSLHGAITAYAYNKPILALNKKVKKLDSFIETWCNDIYCKSIDYDEIATHGNEVMKKWNSNTAKELLTEHQMLVEDYFELIRENLRN